MKLADASEGRQKSESGGGLVQGAAKLLDKIVFVLLLALIVIATIPYGTVDAWWEAVFEIGVFALTALWIFEVLLRGRWEARRLVILLPLAVMTAYIFVQTLVLPAGWLPGGSGRFAQQTLTIDRYQTFLTARKTLALTLFLGLLLLHTSTRGRFRWLIRTVVGLGLASALFGILRQVLQAPDSTSGFVLPFLFPGMGYGEFLSPNVFAYLMEMVFGLLAGLILGGGIPRNRIPIYVAISLFIWTALVLSNSRAGVFSLACQFIFLLFVSLSWYSERQLLRGDEGRFKWLTFIHGSVLVRVLVIVLIAGTLVAGVLWMGGERLASKLYDQPSAQGTLDGTTRQEIWHSTWQLIKVHPFTGVGFGAYSLGITEYQSGSGRLKLEQAHNDYLDLAANGGFLAVALALWFVATIIWRSKSNLRSSDAYRRAACLGALAGMLGVGVHSLVDFGLQVTGIAVVFAALVVIAVADRRVESSAGPRKPERVPITGAKS